MGLQRCHYKPGPALDNIKRADNAYRCTRARTLKKKKVDGNRRYWEDFSWSTGQLTTRNGTGKVLVDGIGQFTKVDSLGKILLDGDGFFFFIYISKETAQGQNKTGGKKPVTRCSLKCVSHKGRSISVAEVYWHSPLEDIQVVVRRKYRGRKGVPEFTSDREESIKVLVHSCIRGLDSIRVSLWRKTCKARPWEEGRHAVSKSRRAVSMKIAIEDWERSNTAARIER